MDENKNKVVEIKTGTTKVIEFKPLASAIKFAALCGVIAAAVYVTKTRIIYGGWQHG
jgi:hypothetical protein